MSIAQPRPASLAALASSRRIPPLDNGDRLTRAEFERRYAAMPQVKKAELIDGDVFMPSAVRLTQHGFPHGLLVTWIGYFFSKTPGLLFGDNTTIRLDEDNEPQPDLLLRLPESAGGKSRLSNDGYLEGAVEFVAEVAASSVSIDLHRKLDAYRRHGVREYLVWRVEDEAVDWFALREGRYEVMSADAQGLLKSEVFTGLWLDPAALLRFDLGRLFQVLDAGAATPQPLDFVERLRGTTA